MTNGIVKHLLNTSLTPFIIDEKTDTVETYKSFHDAACYLGATLLTLGLKKGDRLVIMMENSCLLAKIYFACLYTGITVVPVNPGWSEQQIQFVVENCDANFFMHHAYLEVNTQFLNIPIILVEKNGAMYRVGESPVYQSEISVMPLHYLHEDNVALIIYTSGTTSKPKAVIHTVHNLVGNGRLFVSKLEITEKNKFYNILPMTYLGGYYNLLLIPYLAGGTVVIADAFNANTALNFWDKVIEHEVNTLWLVPAIMAMLMQVDRTTKGSDYSKKYIKLALVGTAPLPLQLREAFQQKYCIQLYENYGLSETLFITTQSPQDVLQATGKPLEGVNVQIVNEEGVVLPPETEGEIRVMTPYVMTHYLGNEDIFAKSKEAYFYTGDLGKLNVLGYLSITGRKKDLIIKGGVNISPAAIEELLYNHPAVLECAVVGVLDPISGEEVVAVIKLKPQNDFDTVKKDLLATCKKQLAVVQQPNDIIEVEDLPRTYTGKIQKAKIRAWLNQHKNTLSQARVHKKDVNNFYKPSHVANTITQALSIAYNNKVYELQSENIPVTVLSLGEAFFDLPVFDFNQLPYPASYHYSHSRGISQLREVIAQYFLSQYDVKFDPATEIVLTAGSKIAIYMTLMAIINPGDEVIIHEPAWVSYPEQVRLCHGIPVQVPYHESVYDFEKYISNRTKVLIINNPNNPKGSVLSLDEIAHLYQLAQKYHLYILSDEAYSDFVNNKEQFISIGNFDKELKFSIICNSISKNFGISGWRIGYVIANKALIDQILKLNQHLITCPPTILTYYIAQHFEQILKITKPQIQQLLAKRQEVINYMEKIGLRCLEGEATFYIFVSIAGTRLSSDDFCHLLLDQHRICVVPGSGYGKSCDEFVRMSIGTEPLAKIHVALDKIKALIQETSQESSAVYQLGNRVVSA